MRVGNTMTNRSICCLINKSSIQWSLQSNVTARVEHNLYSSKQFEMTNNTRIVSEITNHIPKRTGIEYWQIGVASAVTQFSGVFFRLGLRNCTSHKGQVGFVCSWAGFKDRHFQRKIGFQSRFPNYIFLYALTFKLKIVFIY